MKDYKDPVVNVIAFEADIITTSGGNPIETEPASVPLNQPNKSITDD